MEDDELQKPNGLPVETLDMRAQKKHAAMLERLSNSHQSRLQQSAARRTAADFSSPSFESVQSFLSLFSDSKRSVEADLHSCRAIAAADPNAKSQIKLELDKVSASISDLEKVVSEHSYFLPPYEVRSSLKTIEELKEMVESANAEIAPRKKFTFKSKASSKKEPAALAKEYEQFITVSNAASQNISLSDSPGFRNKQGRFRALFIHRLRNCRIFTGPVLGSILIEDVNNCLFMLASHQIRIHQAKECDFYLRVRSRPIIEDCSGLRFAPYRLLYEGIDKDLSDSGLAEETRNWANVDDFLWLRAVQSPNWCLIPEEEFVAVRNFSELEEKSGDT
ncbi:hypothetical protein M5K25_017909 [Dendrobium thyrsiflorum]|uniref:C-CAP/cofactor C-like domain-containing protein n=1 Tax=Dendrobium thyrsiflorum TaxID=117978 RepID=A0ABD0UGI1_DENTH